MHILEQPCDEATDVGLKCWRLGGLLCGITAFALLLMGHGEHGIFITQSGMLCGRVLSAILSVYMFWDRFHQHSHSH